jgi:arginyl-tRNA synthetase
VSQLGEKENLVQREGNNLSYVFVKNMQEEIKNLIKEALKNLKIEAREVVLEHPVDLKMGDYSSNVAMVCAKKEKQNPKELAEKIVSQIKLEPTRQDLVGIKEIRVAEAGFINFYLSREFFTKSVEKILKEKEDWGKNDLLSGKKIMVEYTQPNPFKPFHIGHLMSNAIGESISRMVEFSGAKTVRANYQGDVGLHVAKAIYGLIRFGMPDNTLPVSLQAEKIGEYYAKGNGLYESDENAKKEIDEINKKIYDKSDEKINKIYDWGRKITLEAFEELYKILGTKFDKYYFESETIEIGNKIIDENLGKVFEKSDGAIVFHGEKYDSKLHTRVFRSSQGLPTYEAKELGLTFSKFKKGFLEKNLDLSIVITAVEQAEYMKVVAKAISLLYPKLGEKMKHLTHGMMRFTEGKMSSRLGNTITGESLLKSSMDTIHEKIAEREFSKEEKEKIAQLVGVSALKYSILKQATYRDIIFDFEKSISFEGDSGPYLQYTTVRANSILEKAEEFKFNKEEKIPEEITNLEKLLYQFPEIVERAYQEFAPHYLATYLTELASTFNTFYGNTKILGGDNKFAKYQLKLVKAFYQTMKNGLWLLGIEIPEKM